MPEPVKLRTVKPLTVMSLDVAGDLPCLEVDVSAHADSVDRLTLLGGVEARVRRRGDRRQDPGADATQGQPVVDDRDVLAVGAKYQNRVAREAASTAAWIEPPGPTMVALCPWACAGLAPASTSASVASATTGFPAIGAWDLSSFDCPLQSRHRRHLADELMKRDRTTSVASRVRARRGPLSCASDVASPCSSNGEGDSDCRSMGVPSPNGSGGSTSSTNARSRTGRCSVTWLAQLRAIKIV